MGECLVIIEYSKRKIFKDYSENYFLRHFEANRKRRTTYTVY